MEGIIASTSTPRPPQRTNLVRRYYDVLQQRNSAVPRTSERGDRCVLRRFLRHRLVLPLGPIGLVRGGRPGRASISSPCSTDVTLSLDPRHINPGVFRPFGSLSTHLVSTRGYRLQAMELTLATTAISSRADPIRATSGGV